MISLAYTDAALCVNKDRKIFCNNVITLVINGLEY